MYSFGSGVLIGMPAASPSGFQGTNSIITPTPVNFGLVQEVTIDANFSMKELYGQNQFALALARGTAKVTGKAKMARISGLSLGQLFFGVQPTANTQLLTNILNPVAVPVSPFSISTATVAGSNAAYVTSSTNAFLADLGVTNAATGLPLTRVTGTPLTGQYVITIAGASATYLFSTGDNAANTQVLISYSTTATSLTQGQSFAVNQQLLGFTPSFAINFYTTFQGAPLTITAPVCVSSKLGFGTKLEDFVMPEFDFSLQVNAAGNVMTWSFGDNS